MDVNPNQRSRSTAALNVFVHSDRCFYFLSEFELAQFSVVRKQTGAPIREYLNEARIDHIPHVFRN